MVEQGTRRIAEIDRLIEKVFEQNAAGILSDERFAKMLQSYEKEQKALTQEVADSQQTLQDAKDQKTSIVGKSKLLDFPTMPTTTQTPLLHIPLHDKRAR